MSGLPAVSPGRRISPGSLPERSARLENRTIQFSESRGSLSAGWSQASLRPPPAAAVGGCSSAVERLLCKQNVGSSILLSSTRSEGSASVGGFARRACSSVG